MAFDEDGGGKLDKEEMMEVLQYLEVTNAEKVLERMFEGELPDYELDLGTFKLWLRNNSLMQRKISMCERCTLYISVVHQLVCF